MTSRRDSDLDDPDEIEITLDNIAAAIVNDFKESAKASQHLTAAIQEDLNIFVRKKSNVFVGTVIEVPQDDDVVEEEEEETEEVLLPSGAMLIKSSFSQMKRKTETDFQVAQLIDKYQVDENTRFIRQQVNEQYFRLLPKKVISDFDELSKGLKDIEERESRRHSTIMKKALCDFEMETMNMEVNVGLAKKAVLNCVQDLFASSGNSSDQSRLLKEQVAEVTEKIKGDIISTNVLIEQHVSQTKKNYGSFGSISLENMRKIDEEMKQSVTDAKSKVNTRLLLDGAKKQLQDSAQKLQEGAKNLHLENLKFCKDLEERNRNLKDEVKSVENVVKSTISLKKIENEEEIQHILEDILEAIGQVKKTLSDRHMVVQENIREYDKYKNNFKTENIQRDVELEMIELQENVKKLKEKIQSDLEVDNRISQDTNTRALQVLQLAKNYSVSAFKEADEKMNKDIKMVKLKVAEKLEPLTKLMQDFQDKP